MIVFLLIVIAILLGCLVLGKDAMATAFGQMLSTFLVGLILGSILIIWGWFGLIFSLLGLLLVYWGLSLWQDHKYPKDKS